ncbi:MAG: DNA gyrase C-terminal beta-propeller domain-containing protein [Vampirovibrionales bacterium]
MEKIAELAQSKRIEGISDLRNESDRDGMRVVIELKRDAHPDVVLNNLYKQTPLQQNFGINTLALVDGQPRLMSMPDILAEFIEHRVTVVVRRTRFELNKAEARAHILEGLLTAIGDLDNVIELIRNADSADTARQELMSKYSLDLDQANAILEMQLRRLTGLEREKITAEHNDLIVKIKEYKAILSSRQRVLGIIKDELGELKTRFGEDRKTEIVPEEDNELDMEDLTPNEPMVIFITRMGYIKRISLDTFERQKRATRGKGGIKTKDEDDVVHFFTANNHDKVLFFSDKGVAYQKKVYQVPESGRQAKGTPLINIVPIGQDDKISAVIPIAKEVSKDMPEGSTLMMLTHKGWIKRIDLSHFENIRRSGIISINIEDGDRLLGVAYCQPNDYVILGTANGMAIRFAIDDLRPLGRTARGVTSMKMRDDDHLVDFSIVKNEDVDKAQVLVITTDGYGKRTPALEFRPQNRGGIGLISTKFKNLNSRVANLQVVNDNDELMIVSANGVVVRLKAKSISTQSRSATGVRVQNLDASDHVASVTKIATLDEEASTGTTPPEEIPAEGLTGTKANDVPPAPVVKPKASPSTPSTSAEPDEA